MPLRDPGDRELCGRHCEEPAPSSFAPLAIGLLPASMSDDNSHGSDRGTGVIANAVLSIVSSIIGGGLVLAGQFFVKRAEDKRVWLIRLQEAASDLATSYLQEAATVNDRRRARTDMSDVETATYVVDRQKALGRFRTLPWSSDFEAQRQAMGRTIEGVWRAWDKSDDDFQLAYKSARAAVSEFMAAVGALILREGAHRCASTTCLSPDVLS